MRLRYDQDLVSDLQQLFQYDHASSQITRGDVVRGGKHDPTRVFRVLSNYIMLPNVFGAPLAFSDLPESQCHPLPIAINAVVRATGTTVDRFGCPLAGAVGITLIDILFHHKLLSERKGQP
jgi:hypothetical protein